MQKAKLVKCNEGQLLIGLTIGKLYSGWFSEDDNTFVVESDDEGDRNELYDGEYELVLEAVTDAQ